MKPSDLTKSQLLHSVRQMRDLLDRFLDLCPRMNEGDPIGPALRDACNDTKQLLNSLDYRGSCDSVFTTGQNMLKQKHGTPPEFAKACYECVPGEISMDEARAAIDKYNREWDEARRII